MSQFYRTGGLFSGLGGFFRTVGNVITAPARLAINATASVATKIGSTASGIIGGLIKSTGLTGINIPGVGGLQFGQGPGTGSANAPTLPGGQTIAQEKKGNMLPWILGGVGALGLGFLFFQSRKK